MKLCFLENGSLLFDINNVWEDKKCISFLFIIIWLVKL